MAFGAHASQTARARPKQCRDLTWLRGTNETGAQSVGKFYVVYLMVAAQEQQRPFEFCIGRRVVTINIDQSLDLVLCRRAARKSSQILNGANARRGKFF